MAKIVDLSKKVEECEIVLAEAKANAKSQKDVFNQAEKSLISSVEAVEKAKQALQDAKKNLREVL
jgi:Ribonuclease G/E